MAFYDEAYEVIQVVIAAVESVEDTGVRFATHGKDNNAAYSYSMEACI